MSVQPQRARQLFADVIEKPRPERAELLARACGDDEALRRRVEELLAAHDGSVAAVPESEPGGEQPGDKIGHYKLLERIGEGGFGTVWMAEQEAPLRRNVALKVLKWGMDTRQVVARFEAERQALALMDHPHIAKVYDGGATESGRPFFVMELVRGVPITRYCDEATLSPGERLELFQRVCEAVQHAHQKGVIHRDLKPSNVLVTLHDGRPVPKVIDFGIAKATHGQLTDKTVHTGFRQMLGTPEYMAPEQAEMSGLDVDTRADIYSLGVLLYEILTGTKPFELKDVLEAGYQELLRRIKEVDPGKPSTRVSTLGDRLLEVCKHRRVHPRAFGRLMRGDLDWIVLKAMDKERGRRYATAESLAADIERHLRHEPVEAGPPSRIYKLRKYLRRHRLGAAAGVAIGLSLAAGAVAAGLGYTAAKEQEGKAILAAQRAGEQEQAAMLAKEKESEQRQRAEQREQEAKREAAKSARVVRLLDDMLGSTNPRRGKGKDYMVRQLLDEFDCALRAKPDLDPEVEATLRYVIGGSYLGLTMPDKAAPHVHRAMALHQQIFGEQSREYGDSLRQLALWHGAMALTDRMRTTQHLRESMGLLDRYLAAIDRRSPEGRSAFVGAAHNMSQCLYVLGRLDEAQHWMEQMLELVDPDRESQLLLDGLVQLAQCRREAGNFVGARSLTRRAVAVLREQQSAGQVLDSPTVSNLAGQLREQGELDLALELSEAALSMSREREEDPANIGTALRVLAKTHQARGEAAAAETKLQEAIALVRSAPGRGQRLLAGLLGDLARLREFWQEKLREAEALYRESCAIHEQLTEPDHFDFGDASAALAKFLSKLGQHDEAVRVGRRALEISESWRGKGSCLGLEQHRALAEILGQAGQHREALEEARTAVEGLEALLGSDHAETMVARLVRARCLFVSGARAEAEAQLPTVLTYMHGRTAASFVPADWRVVTHALLLAEAMHDAGITEPAVRLCQAATAVQSLSKDSKPVSTANCLRRLACVQIAHGDLAAARDNARAAWDLLRAPGNANPAAVRELAWFGQLWTDLALTSEDPRDRETARKTALDAMSAIAATKGLVRGIAECKGALACLCVNEHRYREARPLLEAAIAELRERGTSDGTLEVNQERLGLVLLRLGQHAEAEAQLRPLLCYYEERPNKAHSLAHVRSVLSETLLRLNRLDEAEALARLAVQHRGARYQQSPTKKRLGDLAVDQSRLAVILSTQERFAEAEPCKRENLEQWRQLEGEQSSNYASSLHGLARIVQGLGRTTEAVTHLRQARSIAQGRTSPGGHDLLGSIEIELARCLSELGQHDEAEAIARAQLEQRQARLAADDPQVATAQAVLGRVLLARSPASAEAESILRACLATRRAKAPDQWPRFNTMTLLGGCLLAQGRLDEAAPLLRESAEQMPATAHSEHRRQAYANMALLCDATSQSEEAAVWRAKATAVQPFGAKSKQP